jgi:hypothetical protein
MGILITSNRRLDLENWLIHNGTFPGWLPSALIGTEIIYIFYCENNGSIDSIRSGATTLLIPSNGHSIRVGSQRGGVIAAMKDEFNNGPKIAGRPVLIEQIKYIRFITPTSIPGTYTLLQKKEKMKNVIWPWVKANFTIVNTSARDWIPFRTGKGEPININSFIDSIDPTSL